MTIYGQMNLQYPVMGFGFFFLHANPSFHQNLRRRTLLYTVVLSPWQRVLLGLDF